jgi:hypothetical protein
MPFRTRISGDVKLAEQLEKEMLARNPWQMTDSKGTPGPVNYRSLAEKPGKCILFILCWKVLQNSRPPQNKKRPSQSSAQRTLLEDIIKQAASLGRFGATKIAWRWLAQEPRQIARSKSRKVKARLE